MSIGTVNEYDYPQVYDEDNYPICSDSDCGTHYINKGKGTACELCRERYYEECVELYGEMP